LLLARLRVHDESIRARPAEVQHPLRRPLRRTVSGMLGDVVDRDDEPRSA
jgi:hypothetical protein